MDTTQLTVLGSGTMGRGIAQAAAVANIVVSLRDVNNELLTKGIDAIAKSLQRAVDKDKITPEEKQASLDRIVGRTDMEEAIGESHFIIEAIPEDVELKKQVFSEVSRLCSTKTILATNTSTLSITEIASQVENPERVIGVHFFNPVPVMELVELTKGTFTSDRTLTVARLLVEKMGKKSVLVKESPGFIVNRILIPMINEAAFILMEGISSAEDIDKAMQLGANHPIGPLALGDLVGLDVCLKIMETLYQEFGDTKYRPCPLLRKMLRAGFLGRKSGKGFYNYRSR